MELKDIILHKVEGRTHFWEYIQEDGTSGIVYLGNIGCHSELHLHNLLSILSNTNYEPLYSWHFQDESHYKYKTWSGIGLYLRGYSSLGQFPTLSPKDLPIPTGFSNTIELNETKCFKLLPVAGSEEKIGMPVTLKFFFPYMFDVSVGEPKPDARNVTVEVVCNLELSIGEKKFGPYKLMYNCCPNNLSTTIPDPYVPITVTTALGDVIKYSLSFTGNHKTFNPMIESDSRGHGAIGILMKMDVADIGFEIIDANMVSPNELGLAIRVWYPEECGQQSPRKVVFWATINGKDIEKEFDVPEWVKPGEWCTVGMDLQGHISPTTPFRINLADEGVPRFTENQKFDLHGIAYCEGGPESPESKKEVEILLPVIVIHGYLYSHTALGWVLQPLTRAHFYDGLMEFMKRNGGYVEYSDAWYRTLWGPDDLSYQGDKESPSSIVSKIDSWVNAALNRTYADKVNLVGHSLGGLMARYYAGHTANQSKVNKVIMVGSPNKGATLFYIEAFKEKTKTDAERNLCIPGTTTHNLLLWTEPIYQCLYDTDAKTINHPFNNNYGPDYNPSVRYYSIFGTEKPTPYQLTVAKTNGWYSSIDQTEALGDSTVLVESAMTSAINIGVPARKSHAYLCEDSFVKQTILNFLNNKFSRSFSLAGVTSNSSHGVVNPLQTVYHTVSIGTEFTTAQFILSWQEGDLDLVLHEPNKRKIDPTTPTIDPNIRFFGGDNYEQYSIRSPMSGNWTMEIRSVDVPEDGKDYIAIAHLLTNQASFADLNSDSLVNLTDFSILATHWKSQNCSELDSCSGADFNDDGSIDSIDLKIFIEHWLESVNQ